MGLQWKIEVDVFITSSTHFVFTFPLFNVFYYFFSQCSDATSYVYGRGESSAGDEDATLTSMLQDGSVTVESLDLLIQRLERENVTSDRISRLARGVSDACNDVQRQMHVRMTPNTLTPTVLTLWRPLLPYMGTAIKHPVCPDRVKPIICNFWHPGTLTLRAERQSARMSKITNDGLTRSGTKWFIAVAIMATVGVKGLNVNNDSISSVYVHCVQKKTPTHIFFHISVSDVWI